MSALKEFANFITLNMANLATTYARLLAEGGHGYEALPANNRVASGRKLLKAVVEAFELETATPLIDIFNKDLTDNRASYPGSGASSSQRSGNIALPNPLRELECLGQTLTPVVTNLEAGKFLWQILSEVRSTLLESVAETSTPVMVSPQAGQEKIGLESLFYTASSDAIMVLDEKGFLDCNEATLELFGHSSYQQFLNTHPSEQSPPTQPDGRDSRTAADEMIAAAMQKGSNRFEWLHRRADGSDFLAEVLLTAIEFDGKPVLQAVVRDVSDSKQASHLLGKRIRELNCLNEIGREMEEAPPVDELLQWVTERIPPAMSYPELCQAAIEFDGNVYGLAEAIDLPAQMTHGLYIKGEVLGRVYIAYTEKHDFLDEESAMLGAVATRLSGYIENRRLLEETEAALTETETLAREQAVLNELGQALTTRLSVDEVLEEAYRQASRLVDTTNFYIGLYDPEKEEIAFRFDVSESVIDREILVMPASEGIAGYIVRNRTSLLFEDNVREQQEGLGITIVGQDASSWLGVPLIVGDKVLGVMAVQSFTTPGLYNEHSRELLTAIASQVAIALQNARHFEETETTLTDVQQSQTLLRTIIDSTPDWIFIKDQEHRYRLVNQGYADALHIAPDEFIGKNDLELGFPEELVKGNPDKGIRGFWADDRLVMDSGETQVYPNDPATIDGELHTFHTIKTPLRDANGEVWGVLAFARDVSERERLLTKMERQARREQTIREITEKMRAATSLEQLVQTTAEELGRRFSAEYTLVDLGLDTLRTQSAQSENGPKQG